jgi:hypothetical protein
MEDDILKKAIRDLDSITIRNLIQKGVNISLLHNGTELSVGFVLSLHGNPYYDKIRKDDLPLIRSELLFLLENGLDLDAKRDNGISGRQLLELRAPLFDDLLNRKF